MDPTVRLGNLSNLTVGRLAGLQHSSVIMYLAVISLVHRRREILRRSVIILQICAQLHGTVISNCEVCDCNFGSFKTDLRTIA